jgi:malonyl-CoA decarboxylase
MSFFADIISTLLERRGDPKLESVEDGRSLEDLCLALGTSAGEASVIKMSLQILRKYEALDDEEKRDFFFFLAREMGIDIDAVKASIGPLEVSVTRQTYGAFLRAAEPARQELIRRLNQAPGATGRLVNMRQDLLRLSTDLPVLQALDEDFRHLFASWFNRGFLVLRPISWESPAHILEKIIAYEAVHAIDSWDELRRRLQPSDRRCFAFFHPAMPDEPLIFVEVALTKGTPGSVQALLSVTPEDLAAAEIDTAVFYSISNCQAGLAGISFGNSLIKQVASDLAIELPGLKTFVTLSPIPGFGKWLEEEKIQLSPNDAARVRQTAARYLLTVKRSDGTPRDPVARFHLGNGAELHAVHAEADFSERGLSQSAGAMANYLYDLTQASKRQEQFDEDGTVAISSSVKALAASAAEPRA